MSDSAGASRRLSQSTQHYILTSPWPLATPRFTGSDAERVTLIVSTYLRSDSLCYHFRLVLHAQHISCPLYAWYDANRLGLHCTPNPILTSRLSVAFAGMGGVPLATVQLHVEVLGLRSYCLVGKKHIA